MLVSVPATVRLDPPSPPTKSRRMVPSLASEPVVDTEAPLWSPNMAPAPIEASPVSALFDPERRAVLDEGVVSVQVQLRVSGQAGDLTARELDRAVAVEVARCRSGRPPCRSPRCRSRRGAPGRRRSRSDRSRPVLSSDAAVTSSDAESVALPMRRERCWSASPRC